ncbi:MAG: hypothetical protein R3B72_49665 [Polyangiaceae bacterium]
MGVGAILTAIRETAVEASVRLATGAIETHRLDYGNLGPAMPRLYSNAKASEADHRALTRHESAPPSKPGPSPTSDSFNETTILKIEGPNYARS